MTNDLYDVPYMQRTREFYRAQGYDKDYRWASNDDAPFTALNKPLGQSRIGVITTSMPDTELGRGKRAVYASPSDPLPTSRYTAELSWHQSMTHTDDVGSFLPLAALEQLQQTAVVGKTASRFYSLPTEYSQRNTLTKDAPAILDLVQQDEVDVVMLVPL
jgi:hypothetical protein